MAQALKGSISQQNGAEKFYNAQIDMYERTAVYHKYPANDVAFAYVYFISNSYEIYHDLTRLPLEKDPWAKRAKDGFERISLMNLKKISQVTPAQDKAMYLQFKAKLAAKPSFRKMTDAEKQKLTETLAIKYGLMFNAYMRAIEVEDENAINKAHQMAKEGLEEALGIPVERVKITNQGVTDK